MLPAAGQGGCLLPSETEGAEGTAWSSGGGRVEQGRREGGGGRGRCTAVGIGSPPPAGQPAALPPCPPA